MTATAPEARPETPSLSPPPVPMGPQKEQAARKVPITQLIEQSTLSSIHALPSPKPTNELFSICYNHWDQDLIVSLPANASISPETIFELCLLHFAH